MPLSSNTYPTLKLFALSVLSVLSVFYTSSTLAIETTNSFSAPSLTLVRDSDGVQVPIDLSDADGTERMLCYDASEQKVILGKMSEMSMVPVIRHTFPGDTINTGGDGCNTANPQNFMDCPPLPPSNGSTPEAFAILNQFMSAGYTHPDYVSGVTSSYFLYVCRVSDTILRFIRTDNVSVDPPPADVAFFYDTVNYFNRVSNGSSAYVTLLCQEEAEVATTTCEP